MIAFTAEGEAAELEPSIRAIVKKANIPPGDLCNDERLRLRVLETIQTQNGKISFQVIEDQFSFRIATSGEVGDLKTFQFEDFDELWEFAFKLQRTDEWIIRHLYVYSMIVKPIERYREDLLRRRFRRSGLMVNRIVNRSHLYHALFFNRFAC